MKKTCFMHNAFRKVLFLHLCMPMIEKGSIYSEFIHGSSEKQEKYSFTYGTQVLNRVLPPPPLPRIQKV